MSKTVNGSTNITAITAKMPGGAGTISEVALALKAGRPVVTVRFDVGSAFAPYRASGLLRDAASPAEAFGIVLDLIGGAAQ